MGYTRKKNRKGGTKKRRGGAWWGIEPKKIIKANEYRVSRNKNMSCETRTKTPELQKFIKLCVLRATIQRVGRFNINLEDIRATQFDQYPITADPKFRCYIQTDEDAKCVRDYLKKGTARIVDSLFPSMRDVDDVKPELRKACIPPAPVKPLNPAAAAAALREAAAAKVAEKEAEEAAEEAAAAAAEAAAAAAEAAAKEKKAAAEARKAVAKAAAEAAEAAEAEAAAEEAEAAEAEAAAEAAEAAAEARRAAAEAAKAEAGARKAAAVAVAAAGRPASV